MTILMAAVISFDASAVVFQSAEKALSYRNVARSRKAPKPVTVEKPKEPERIPETKYVDLTERYSAEVYLQKGDSVEVTILDEKCCKWKISSDHALLQTDNKVANGKRTVKFKKIIDNKAGNIYLDSFNKEDGSTVSNKAVYVKGI